MLRKMRILSLTLALTFSVLTTAEPKPDQLLKQYQTALASLKEDDDTGHQQLALWCRSKRLTKEEGQLWKLLFERKRTRIKEKPSLSAYQGLVSWCLAQGLKPAAEEAKRDQTLFEYAGKKAALAADDTKGMQALALWCQNNQLPLEARDLLQAILVLQPDNAQVIKQLETVRQAAWAEAPTGLLKKQKVSPYTQETAWYHISVPKEYKDAKQALPLVIFLHGGAHNAGTADNIVALAEVIPAFKKTIVLFPNHLKTWWYHPREMTYLLDTIDQVQIRWRLDPKRIVLMGASMGGNGTWGFGSHCPEIFAALAPMSGFWAPFLNFPMQNLATKPIYVLHGTQDQTVPISGARQAFAIMQKAGANIIMREPECAHQLPNDEIAKAAEWVLQYSNKQTFDIKALKTRIAAMAVPESLKRYEGN